jgi:hypothetical protein
LHFALWPAVFPVGIVIDGLADHRLEVVRDGLLFGLPSPVQRSRIEPLVASRYIGASRYEAPNSVRVPAVRGLVHRPGWPLRELQRSLERIARMHRRAWEMITRSNGSSSIARESGEGALFVSRGHPYP